MLASAQHRHRQLTASPLRQVRSSPRRRLLGRVRAEPTATAQCDGARLVVHSTALHSKLHSRHLSHQRLASALGGEQLTYGSLPLRDECSLVDPLAPSDWCAVNPIAVLLIAHINHSHRITSNHIAIARCSASWTAASPQPQPLHGFGSGSAIGLPHTRDPPPLDAAAAAVAASTHGRRSRPVRGLDDGGASEERDVTAGAAGG